MVVQYEYICIRFTSRRASPLLEVPEVLPTHTPNRKKHNKNWNKKNFVTWDVPL